MSMAGSLISIIIVGGSTPPLFNRLVCFILLPRPVCRKCDFLRLQPPPLKFDLVAVCGKLYISVERSMQYWVHKLATGDEFIKRFAFLSLFDQGMVMFHG